MFCPKCGKELPPGAGFCPNCGTPTGESAPQRTPTSSKSSSSIGRSMEDVVGKNSAYYLTEFQKIEEKQKSRFNWAALLVPFGIVALAGAGIGTALFIRRRREVDDGEVAE